jgi:hypothetical protein
VDAAVGKGKHCGAVATVATSDAGVYMGAYGVTMLGKSDAKTLEVLACRVALALAHDINYILGHTQTHVPLG